MEPEGLIFQRDYDSEGRSNLIPKGGRIRAKQLRNAFLARELMEVLDACHQEVPMELCKAAESSSHQKGGPKGLPPLDENCPPMATAGELEDWHDSGRRCWSYSANGGVSEQGRLEFRSQGQLRTTWGWGDWKLIRAGAKTHMAVSSCCFEKIFEFCWLLILVITI